MLLDRGQTDRLFARLKISKSHNRYIFRRSQIKPFDDTKSLGGHVNRVKGDRSNAVIRAKYFLQDT